MTNKLSNQEVKDFRNKFGKLIDVALRHLMEKEWVEEIDKNVRIHIAIINEKEVHFELMLDMIGKLLATKSYTWEQINDLIDED